MSYRNEHGGGYVVPSYQAPDGAPWYHFLHGNVPGHEIDFIYRPDVPQGQLTEQHFSHLARLMKDIEPPASCPYAFAIGNLSRDDTQHEPGHGGVAILFGMRIHGALDHAGRNDPPFAHAIVAIDRELDPSTLLASARAFHQRVLGATGPSGWYRDYVRCATEGPSASRRTLESYVASFDTLPPPRPSTMGLKWTSRGDKLPRRVVIVHGNDASFDSIAWCAAKIAAMLYQSDLRWTSISNGREADVPNGMSIRFVAQSDLVLDPADQVHQLHEIPEEEGEIARQIFNAKQAVSEERPAMQGWREHYADQRISSMGDPAAEAPRPLDGDPAALPRIDEDQADCLSSPELTLETTVVVDTCLPEDPEDAVDSEEREDTLVMKPSAASTVGEEPEEISIDCSSFDSIAPAPAANDISLALVDRQSEDQTDDAPVAPRRSRRLLIGAALGSVALMIAIAMAAIPTTVPQEPSAPSEGGAGALAEPSSLNAPSPSEGTASAHTNAPDSNAKEPGASQRAAGKAPPGKAPWQAKGAKKTSGPKTGPGSQRSPRQGAGTQTSGNPGQEPESTVGVTPSSVFGATRENAPAP